MDEAGIGEPYYKYMLCYAYDLLNICFKLKKDMDALNMIYLLMEGFEPPDQYLVANVEKVQLNDGRVVWFTNCDDYLKSANDNDDNSTGVDKMALKNDGDGNMPYSSSFMLELDITEELGEELTNRY